MRTDEAKVKGFEVTKLALVEGNQERDYLTLRQGTGAIAASVVGQEAGFEARQEILAEIIDRTEQREERVIL